MQIVIQGDWAQLWGVLDNLPTQEAEGLIVDISAEIGPEYMIKARLKLRGYEMYALPDSFQYRAHFAGAG